MKLVDSALPLLDEHAVGGFAIGPAQRLGDFLVGKSRERYAGSIAKVRCQIPPRHLAQSSDEIEETAIGAALEKDAMPFVFEVHTARGVSPGLLQPRVYLGKPSQSLGGELGCQIQGEGLERAENLSHLGDLDGVERGNPEAATHVGLERTFAGQTEQGFAHRGTADTERGGQVGVTHSASGRGVPTVNGIEDLSVDLIAKRRSGYCQISICVG